MQHDYQNALKIYQELNTTTPDNPHYLYNLGETLFTLGKYNEALQIFGKVKDLPNSIPQAHLRLTACLEALGEKNEAKEYLNMLTKAEAPDWFKTNVQKELARLNGPVKKA